MFFAAGSRPVLVTILRVRDATSGKVIKWYRLVDEHHRDSVSNRIENTSILTYEAPFQPALDLFALTRLDATKFDRLIYPRHQGIICKLDR